MTINFLAPHYKRFSIRVDLLPDRWSLLATGRAQGCVETSRHFYSCTHSFLSFRLMGCKNSCLIREKTFSGNVYRVALSISTVSFPKVWLGGTTMKAWVYYEHIPLACASRYTEDPPTSVLSFFCFLWERKKGHLSYFHIENHQINLYKYLYNQNKYFCLCTGINDEYSSSVDNSRKYFFWKTNSLAIDGMAQGMNTCLKTNHDEKRQ